MNGQLTFDLDALDDPRVRELYTCGIHEQRRQVSAHWDDCLHNICARCGEESPNSFLSELNHGVIEWRKFCGKQIACLNHAARCRMILDGAWPHDPQTNCYAGHDHTDRKSGSYFSKGAPMECVQGEFDICRAWLIGHKVDADMIGSLGRFNAERAA